MVALRKVVYHPGLIGAMDRELAYMTFASRLLAAGGVFELKRPMCFNRFAVHVDNLERHFWQD